MAIVYRARQEHPVERTVALKLIKLGMDTRQFVARFEAERQALALMDHPNVAHVYDAGSTATGRPYFVMEYVPGTPILEHCDERMLGPAIGSRCSRSCATPSSTRTAAGSSTATSRIPTCSSRRSTARRCRR
jgi:serine/threonine protein kinase